MEIIEQSLEPVDSPFISQEWSQYSADDHAVWSILYARRMEQLERTASRVFLEGIRLIGLEPHQVPDLDRVNRRLAALTGWSAVPVRGFLPASQFFACLAQRRFPTTVSVRPRSSLDYVPEPDIFHDVFGHVPLHAHPVFADALEQLGRAGVAARHPADLERLTRLFWFTVEFGLASEDGEIRIYGSGLISSHGDAANAFGPDCQRKPFNLDQVVSQSFEIDRLQPVLFVLESFDQLFEAVRSL